MLNKEHEIIVELVDAPRNKTSKYNAGKITNPIEGNCFDNKNLLNMISDILDKEMPMLKHNSLIRSLVLYTLTNKMNTVQKVENVLSYIKKNHVKEVQDVCFRNGEIYIKCSI